MTTNALNKTRFADRGAPRREPAAVPVILLVVTLLVLLTFSRNGLWLTGEGIWMDTLGKSPAKARPWYNLGQAHERKGRLERARSAYEAAVRLKPDYYQAQNNLGNVYLALDRAPDAIRAFRASIEAHPDAAALSHDNLGFVLFSLGRYEEAVREYRAAIALEPRRAEVRNNLGYVYLAMGRVDDAVSEFRTALALEPGLDAARVNLAGALARDSRPPGRVVP
jgi:tetratricopeptide (TPR) repeat protein